MREPERERAQIEQILGMLCLSGGEDARPDGDGAQAAAALAELLDEMPGGFLIYYADRGEEIVYANRALLRIFQCETMDEFRAHTGNSFRGLVHPDDLDEVEQSICVQIAASQYDLDYVEYRIRRRDGAIRWIEDYGHFVRSRSLGDIFYVFLGDATEKRDRMLMEKNLLLNERLEEKRKLQDLIQEYDKERALINQEYLRQLEVIEGLSVNYDAICFVDLERDQIVPYRLSERTSELFYEKLPDRTYSKYADSYVELWVHPEDRDLVARSTAPEYIREKLADARTYYFNYRVLAGEELQYLQLRAVNVGHEHGVSQVVLGYRRVDDEIRREMEQQALLAEALDKANLAITSKDTFLSNMSHDMRTPLNAILGFATLAKMNLGKPEEVAGYLGQLETAGRQLLDMIDKVLNASALSEQSGGGLDERECDLRGVVQDVYDFLKPQAQEKDILFTLSCAGLTHIAAYTDQEKLRQLIMYLANNAVTYTDPGGRVSISVSEAEELPNGYVVYRFMVEDTGIGISPEFLEKVFEPFSREKNTTLSGVHGIGLGLAIVKNLVDIMGGTLDVKSEVGVGSAFTVTLAFRVQPLAEDLRLPASCGKAVQRLLLVEDNDINREIAEELLGMIGFEIDSAENGQIALDKVKGSAPGHYDLVLMDLQMPVMDGWQASREIRALPDRALARIPIVALSANVLESDRNKSKECGIDAHLPKPMDLAQVVSTIEELTGKRCPS